MLETTIILGFYFGKMENKMETTNIMGLYRDYIGSVRIPGVFWAMWGKGHVVGTGGCHACICVSRIGFSGLSLVLCLNAIRNPFGQAGPWVDIQHD